MKNFLLAGTLGMVLLSGCGNYDTTLDTINSPATVPAVVHPLEQQIAGLQPTLVARYHRMLGQGSDPQNPLVKEFKYQPRQSEFSGYEGWDVLTTPYPWGTDWDNSQWLHLTLNREARLVVVLSEDQYAKALGDNSIGWLETWTKGASSAQDESGSTYAYVTYRKDFAKGEVTLPPIQEIAYLILLAEKNGVPSAAPLLPKGITETPKANETCPSWLSTDVWVAKGPDGNLYKTWHPQIDPVYWCYYRHEHGSDPALVGYQAAFGYVAVQNNFQPELHEGFKGFAIRDEARGVGWYINVHAETGVISRACVRFHTVVVAATNLTTGEKLLELSYKGDFGVAQANSSSGGMALQPKLKDCPDQAAILKELEADKTGAARNLRVFSNGVDPSGYERWDGGMNRRLAMNTDYATGMSIDIEDPATGCKDVTCTDVAFTGGNAVVRTLDFNYLNVAYDATLDNSDAVTDGFFKTDVYGVVQSDPAKNVIIQYIKPGFNETLDGEYQNEDAWRGLYTQDSTEGAITLESAIRPNN